jgi:DNA-binding transcriptional LysR family regulator
MSARSGVEIAVPFVITPALPRFLARHPRVEVEVQVENRRSDISGSPMAFEPQVAPFLKRGSLRLVLEAFAASVPGFFLYFPSRAQVSPALRAFMDTAREVTVRPRKDSR